MIILSGAKSLDNTNSAGENNSPNISSAQSQEEISIADIGDDIPF